MVTLSNMKNLSTRQVYNQISYRSYACITKFLKENRVKIKKKQQGPIFPSLIEVIQKQGKGSQNNYLIWNKNDDILTGKIK